MLKLNFCVVTFFISTVLQAQIPKDTSSATKIKVFAPSKTTKKNNGESGYTWAIKFDIVSSLVGGDIPISFERKITPKISLEGSLGLTYGGNLITIIDNDSKTKAALGFSQRGTLKFYPSSYDEAIEGWYIALSVHRRVFNRTYIDPLLLDKKEKISTLGVQIISGKQMFIDDNLPLECGLGVGIGTRTTDYYALSNGVYNNGVYNYVPTSGKKSELVPTFTYFIKVGLGY